MQNALAVLLPLLPSQIEIKALLIYSHDIRQTNYA
jgi:hypothetical protein